MKQFYLDAIASWDGCNVEHLIEVLTMFAYYLRYEHETAN